MEKEVLRIPRPLRKVAGKLAFTIPREIAKHANLEVNKTYVLVILDAKEKEKQQQ